MGVVRPSLRIVLALATIMLLVLVGRLWLGGYLDRNPVWHYPPRPPASGFSVLLFSGDAGLRKGMGPYMSHEFARHGIETTAISTPTLFRGGVDRARLDAIVAGYVGRAETSAGSRPLVVIGQSYGADILQTGLADLPAAMRRAIARIVLIVPGTGTYYRADPTGLLYHLRPDSRSIETASTLRWAPLTCIYGRDDDDDLCASLHMPNAHVVGLPGNHYLNHDKPLLAATVLHEIRTSKVR